MSKIPFHFKKLSVAIYQAIIHSPVLFFYSLSAAGLEALQPRHHPEHSARSGRGPRHSGAVLRPGEDVLAQHPLLRRGQKRGAQSLPQHDSRLLRLSIVAFSPSSPPAHLNLTLLEPPPKNTQEQELKEVNFYQPKCHSLLPSFKRPLDSSWRSLRTGGEHLLLLSPGQRRTAL